MEDSGLTTTFTYDAMANLQFTSRPTLASVERIYDDFDRLEQIKRIPGAGAGNTITTAFEYDEANNVIRTIVDENAVVLSDTTAQYDEGGFNYQTRQRMVANTDGATDPITERKFDWAGHVIEDRSLGDATVIDRVVTTMYDEAGRVERRLDSEGGETEFTVRDGRGNVTLQTVKINATDSAVTDMEYDALSRSIKVTEPENSAGLRADRVRAYDSRGNLLSESIRDAADVKKLTTIFAYDNAGRQTRRAVLAVATAATVAANADVTMDRVTDFQYDADGRLRFRRSYNNNTATPLETETTYDDLGRTDSVIDPSGGFTDDDYDADGRLSQRAVFDGVGTRTFTFGYDGHDRVTSRTALGLPDLVTTFELDGLDRRVRTTDPRDIASKTEYDLVGRRKRLIEDELGAGALKRQTDFGYNRLSQLITQTAQNKKNSGAPLDDQVTMYRYDSLGRQTRIVYPDAAQPQHDNPLACSDCVRAEFDLAGRMTQRTDQRGLVTVFAHDDRGLLLTRTTGTDLDTFGYDSVGRMTLAERGIIGNTDLVSDAVRVYTDLSDLDFETQTIAEGTGRVVNYDYDQAGNRIQLTYPGGGVALAYTPTVLNQVDTVTLNAAPFLDYDYNGRLLDTRRTITSDLSGTMVYEYGIGYDSHRRVNAIINRFETSARASQTVVGYGFTHDDNGNPLTQTVTEGLPAFVADDRVFTVDRLNRLTDTEYLENGQVESTAFDLVGNRESHTNRTETTTVYGEVNKANEYPTIGGIAVSYDEAGNISGDQAGRHYDYDEQNRLIQIKAADETVLANYTYDALGRRIVFEDPVAAVTTRYYYDGQSVIEERDAADVRVRYHINGAQFIDERVATFTEAAARSASGTSGSARSGSIESSGTSDSAGSARRGSIESSSPSPGSTRGTGEFTYYLVNQSFSIAGTGNADGTAIERLDYSSTGDFAGGGSGPAGYFHDADADFDLDLRDFAGFQNCFGDIDPACLAKHDFDTADVSDGDVDFDDYVRYDECSRGPFVTPDQICGIPSRGGTPPPSGTFTLHGRPVDILSDDHAIIPIRARYYDPVIGRWLQRDPTGFADGANLYESFRNNQLAFIDPFGTDAFLEFIAGPPGRGVSTFDVVFSRETADILTFGLFNLSADPVEQARRHEAFEQGVISPTITAGEFALVGPAGGIRNFLLRNATIGFIFSTGEFGRDLIVEDRVQSAGEFAAHTVVFAGAGATLEGVFFVGGRVIALFRQSGRAVALDVTEQIAISAADDVAALVQTPLGQLIRQAEAESSMMISAAGRQQLLLQQGATPAVLRMSRVAASGELGELSALGLLRSRGETIIGTQFRQGAVLRGFDTVSALQTPQGLRVFVNEVKASSGNIVPSRFSAMGLNRASTFTRNILRAQDAVRVQVADPILQQQIITALRNRTFTVRIMGPPGVRFTPRTAARIQQATGTGNDVLILEIP